MSTETEVNWSWTTFRYSVNDVKQIEQSLKHNGRSVHAAYMCLADSGSEDFKRGPTDSQIHLIERVFDGKIASEHLYKNATDLYVEPANT